MCVYFTDYYAIRMMAGWFWFSGAVASDMRASFTDFRLCDAVQQLCITSRGMGYAICVEWKVAEWCGGASSDNDGTFGGYRDRFWFLRFSVEILEAVNIFKLLVDSTMWNDPETELLFFICCYLQPYPTFVNMTADFNHAF